MPTNLSGLLPPNNSVRVDTTDTLTNKTIEDPAVVIGGQTGSNGEVIVTDGSGNFSFAGTEGLRIPAGTTGERPQNPIAGEIRYNTDNSTIEKYDGTSWSSILEPTDDLDVTSLSVAGNTIVDSNFKLQNVKGVNNILRKPTNIGPADQDTNVGNLLTDIDLSATGFGSLFAGQGGAQFQVSETSDFATTVIDRTVSGGSINSANLNLVQKELNENTTYYWRVRYFDSNNNFSLFSDPTEFTTASAFAGVDTPTITSPANNATDIGEEPTITTSAFSVTGPSDTHVSTDWQIATDAAFTNIVYESLDDASNLTSLDVPAGNLQDGTTTYYVRVRHTGSTLGDSDFSSDIEFTTSASFFPALGDSYNGGFYMGAITAAGQCYALVVAPNATGCACCQWKTSDTSTSGTCSDTDGYANTYPALENSTHPAGNWTATRTIGGFSDWYLPAIDELEVFYNNGAGGGTGDPLPSGEDFATDSYWSSTEYSSLSACCSNLSYSGRYGNSKELTLRVRAVRRVPI